MDTFNNIKILDIKKKGLPYVGQVDNYATVEFYNDDKLIETKEIKFFDQETIFTLLEKGQELERKIEESRKFERFIKCGLLLVTINSRRRKVIEKEFDIDAVELDSISEYFRHID